MFKKRSKNVLMRSTELGIINFTLSKSVLTGIITGAGMMANHLNQSSTSNGMVLNGFMQWPVHTIHGKPRMSKGWLMKKKQEKKHMKRRVEIMPKDPGIGMPTRELGSLTTDQNLFIPLFFKLTIDASIVSRLQ